MSSWTYMPYEIVRVSDLLTRILPRRLRGREIRFDELEALVNLYVSEHDLREPGNSGIIGKGAACGVIFLF